MSESEGPWEELRPGGPHVWRTLGYWRTASEPGRMEIEWDATEDYTFPDGDGSIVHGARRDESSAGRSESSSAPPSSTTPTATTSPAPAAPR